MISRLGPLDINCDAPPYGIVKACQRVGFAAPLDVAWFRMKNLAAWQGDLGGTLATQTWSLLFGKNEAKEPTCFCGMPLPALDKYAFTTMSGRVADYLLGQCPRCRRVYWEEG